LPNRFFSQYKTIVDGLKITTGQKKRKTIKEYFVFIRNTLTFAEEN